MKLGEVCTINPKAPSLSDDLEVSFVPMPKVGENGEFDPSEIRVLKDVKKGFTYFSEGDVLFAKITPCMENGKGAVARNLKNDAGYGSTEFHVLRPNEGKVLSEWIYYLTSLPAFRKEAEKNMTGSAGQKRVPKAFLENYQIELPTVDMQEQQVDALKKISNLIQKRKQQLEKLDELVKARFVEMFGDPELNPLSWPKVPLGNVITNANNGMARRGNDVEGSIVMRLVELQDGYIDYSAPNRIILNDAEKRRYLLRDNDFLFARVNGNPENVGRCAVFCDIGEPVYHNDHIIRVHFDEALINGAFASALFNSTYGKRQMSSQIKTSAGQYTISQDGIGAIVTILPPLSLQERFAALVEQTDKSKVEIKKSLEQMETLKKALMQKYFG